MALCHPSLQEGKGKLTLTDAENAWFVRVNHLEHYGTDVHLEKLAAEPPVPLLFLSIDAVPGSRALIWEHIEDAPGKRCPNPRLIIPRKAFPDVVEGAVTVDIRSFGVRTPPCTKEKPTYGIIGVFHILPPSLAWLWRLVSPRGHANPSIVDTEGMTSEGVGSYWPFATGRRVDQANLLLRQFADNTADASHPVPQPAHWRLARGLHAAVDRARVSGPTRRGEVPSRSDHPRDARCWATPCTNAGRGSEITHWFLQVEKQREVGPTATTRGPPCSRSSSATSSHLTLRNRTLTRWAARSSGAALPGRAWTTTRQSSHRSNRPMRWLVLTASVLVSFCLGGVYAWSAYVPALRAECGLTTTQCQAVFGVTILVFTLVMVPAGRMLRLVGPRAMAAGGGVMLGAGYALASAGGGSFASLLAGVGVVGGAGIGLAYLCPITVCVRWFPAHRGLITGVTVCGFGAGGVGVASLVATMQAQGAGAMEMLRWMAVAYAAIVVPAAMMLAMPRVDGGGVPPPAAPMRGILRDPAFAVLALGMFAGTFAGLMIIGNLRAIGEAAGMTRAAAMVAISLFAVGNAAGRITWGWLADRAGAVCIPASLAVLAAAIAMMLAPRADAALFLAAVTTCGFGFGACFVVYAAQVVERFGVGGLGTVYPLVFLLYGLSGVLGPMVGGGIFDATGSFRPAMMVAFLVAGGGAMSTAFIRAAWGQSCERKLVGSHGEGQRA